MEAAFFDLDKTVISRSSVFAVGLPIYREGLLNRRLLLTGIYRQLLYSLFGADEATMDRARDDLLRVTEGWNQAKIVSIVEDVLESVIGPIVHAEALEAIAEHRRAGRRIYIVSSSPEEIVRPLGRFIGVDDVVATRAEIDDGVYTGRLDFYCYGEAKAQHIDAIAAEEGIDLSGSWAYSDSVTDVPMLASVGNPVAVNADRKLRREARARGWPLQRWQRTMLVRRRIPTPPPKAAIGLGVTTAVGTAAAAGLWWLRRPAGDGVARLEHLLVRSRMLPPRPPPVVPGWGEALGRRARAAAHVVGTAARSRVPVRR